MVGVQGYNKKLNGIFLHLRFPRRCYIHLICANILIIPREQSSQGWAFQLQPPGIFVFMGLTLFTWPPRAIKSAKIRPFQSPATLLKQREGMRGSSSTENALGAAVDDFLDFQVKAERKREKY